MTHRYLTITEVLLAFQIFHVLFLLLHDWVPLGSLNDVQAIRNVDSFRKRLAVTLVSAAAFIFCLYASVVHLGRVYPEWLLWWLWCSYGLLFLGELRAWWIPYLLVPDEDRAARYQALFGNTQSFLPARNGIRPNTLHIILHLTTLALLAVLAMLTFSHQR